MMMTPAARSPKKGLPPPSTDSARGDLEPEDERELLNGASTGRSRWRSISGVGDEDSDEGGY